MALSHDYSTNWKDLGNILMYQTLDYQFLPSLMLTDFEGCLVKRLSNARLYNTIDTNNTTPVINDAFLKQLSKDATDHSVVIISNIICNGKLTIDALKRKFEAFMDVCKIPMLALFALKPDKFCKPHTGMWDLLNGYYRSNQALIQKAMYISDAGGRVITTEKKDGTTYTRFDKSDTDRAFAHNIDIDYQTINEYLSVSKKEKFNWNKRCLPPDIRVLYLEKLAEYTNPNIFARLAELGQSETYMIMIYGAPRAGKTTLAKEIISKWRASEYGKTHAIKRFDRLLYSKTKRINLTKKTLQDRISVIIDGDCHTSDLRKPFLDMVAETNTLVLHIEVNPGIGMAYIFNHSAVEEATSLGVHLYPDKDYYIYKSVVTRPSNALLYCPVIKKTDTVMKYRY